MPPRHVPTGAPRGPKPRPLWESAVSVRAGLPANRTAWLARVLPLLADAARSLREIDVALGVPLGTVSRWRAWLETAREAGELPELAEPLPALVAGWNPGRPVPRPTAEQAAAAGRKGAAARKAAEQPKVRARPKKKTRAKR